MKDHKLDDILLTLEYKIQYLERLLQFIINHNPELNRPSQSELGVIKEDSVAEVKKKYPDSDVTYYPG